MNEIKPKKLSLSAETLRPLTPGELEDVNGGGTIWNTIKKTVTIATRNICPSVTVETVTRVLNCNGNGQAQ